MSALMLGGTMRRREFISLIGGAAAAWPLAVQAQATKPVVGYLSTGTRESDAVPYLAPFRQGLKEMGYVEGRNVEIEYRWAEFQNGRLADLAADLVGLSVDVIATIGGSPPAFAARTVTTKIPIVFYSGVDPVKSGLVKSLNRPGGNATGIAALQAQLIAKRIELLNETVPNVQVVTLLINPTNPYSETETEILYGGARSLRLQLHVVRAERGRGFRRSFQRANRASDASASHQRRFISSWSP